jgi:hypothetical protein
MHLRTNTPLGKQIRINLNWIQLHLGSSTPLFQQKKKVKRLTNWFTSIQHFLWDINSTLSIPGTLLPVLDRIGDVCIMDAVGESTQCNLSLYQQNQVNNWRLYFQVQTLSDLSTACGDKILEVYLQHPTSETINDIRNDRCTKLNWPYQPPPTSTTSFKLWTKTLRDCFIQSGTTLKSSLGDWIVSHQQSQSKWQSYTTSTFDQLYTVSHHQFQLYSKSISNTNRTTSFHPDQFTLVEFLPHDAFPVDITKHPTRITLHHAKRIIRLPQPIPEIPKNNIEQSIENGPKWKRQILQHFRIHDMQDFSHSLNDRDHKFLLVSDGGHKDETSSFGVAMGTYNKELCSIEGPAPGNPSQLTSFRSEAYGMLAGIAFLHEYMENYNVIFDQPRIIHLFCDNMALVTWLQRLLQQETHARMFIKSESDVLLQIYHEIQACRQLLLQFQIEHVYGHQDDNTPYQELSRPAQLNVDADSYASNFLQQGKQGSYIPFPSNPIDLYVNGQIITRNHKTHIRHAALSQNLREYLIKKFKWSTNIPDLIWWQVHGSTIGSFSKNDQRRIRKFIFNWLPTSERLKMYTPAISNLCPSCKTCVETSQHIVKCNTNSRILIKDMGCKNLESFLKNESHTPPAVLQIFMRHLNLECNHNLPDFDIQLSEPIMQAYIEQNNIGWTHLLKGRLSTKWGTVIATHLATQKVSEKEMTALIWGRTVTKLLFQFVLQLWQSRNNEAHLLNANKESILSRQRILANIEALQATNPTVRHCDQDFIYRDFSVLQTYSLSNLTSWYRMARSIIQQGKSRRPTSIDIRECFTKVHDPDNPTQTPTTQTDVLTNVIPLDPNTHIEQSLDDL